MSNNHTYNVMRKAHDYLFKFHPLSDNEEWDIPLISSNKASYLKDFCMTDRTLFNSENFLEYDGSYLENAQAFKMLKKPLSIDNRKKEFVYMQQDCILIFGQINKKHQTNKHTIQHWVITDSEQRMDNEKPYKTIKRYRGCSLNDKRINKETHGCYFNKDHGLLTNCFNNSSNTFTKLMGTGWVILNNKDEVILECNSSITDWPSSTRVKLEAILSATLVLQTGQKANIITDSQAAIDSINYIRTNLTNVRNKTGKVKGHSEVKNKLCETILDAAWSLNRTYRSVFSDITNTIEEEIHQTLETSKLFAFNFRNYEGKKI
ncbi:hypothetical protein C1646_772908 [Rhizophagus diaphanus]|nr:hypothetical protein C1646_772908 [Rhizophagus diaphanus] [Rhizophagus sp. MUCL 43196]